jgi:hypothetical protein
MKNEERYTLFYDLFATRKKEKGKRKKEKGKRKKKKNKKKLDVTEKTPML